jgi:hypothetical protein
MSENNTANQEVEKVEQPIVTSQEDKFFGVKHSIQSEKEAEEASESEFEVEIIDDRPIEDRKPPKAKTSNTEDVEQEIDGITDKVQKRIDKLKYEFHEERRAKEAAERLREEAVNYAQGIQHENKRLSALINKGEEALLGQISAKSSAEVAKAEQEFKEAYEAGDTEKMVLANKKLASAQVDLKSADERLKYYQQQQDIQQNNVEQPTQAYQNPTQIPLSDLDKKWLEENSWWSDPKYTELRGFALGINEKVIREGYQRATKPYYDEIDKRLKDKLGKVYPEIFESKEDDVATETESIQSEVETAISKTPSNVVAPATRNNGAMPRKVQLTSSQVSLARRLGLTPEQLAMQIAKESKNGR